MKYRYVFFGKFMKVRMICNMYFCKIENYFNEEKIRKNQNKRISTFIIGS